MQVKLKSGETVNVSKLALKAVNLKSDEPQVLFGTIPSTGEVKEFTTQDIENVITLVSLLKDLFESIFNFLRGR
jgi:hypothetical protein